MIFPQKTLELFLKCMQTFLLSKYTYLPISVCMEIPYNRAEIPIPSTLVQKSLGHAYLTSEDMPSKYFMLPHKGG